ncbi:Ras association domain-containing protein 8 [Gryllus bimaculatus]|nr:Ras association domain-containing protein 8 [Gryllus bimaculatus]
MELKVWVEGIERIVCGVTDNTTCQDVVYALAHATGKTGRFTLIERWRNNERLLAPHEHPLKILTKWGEYSNDVQFILQRSSIDSSKVINQQAKTKVPDSLPGFMPSTSSPISALNDSFDSRPSLGPIPDRNKDIRKSLTFSGSHHVHGLSELRRGDNIGIVKGVPQVKPSMDAHEDSSGSGSPKTAMIRGDENCSPNQDGGRSPAKREAPPYRDPPCPASPPQRSLPPYRDPPPPIHSPSRGTPPRSGPSPMQDVSIDSLSPTSKAKPKRNLLKLIAYGSWHIMTQKKNLISAAEFIEIETQSKDLQDFQQSGCNESDSHQESVLYNAQYRDLVRLVNYQREKLTSQQAELTKFDAEIVFWESKTREQHHQLEYLTQEAARMEKATRITEDQVTGPIPAIKNPKKIPNSPHKPGSTRKMIGSPRQLENAVPTSKNPHGVWV